MQLIALGTLRTAVGEPDFEDINTLMGTAISMIPRPLEQLLRTQFAYRERTDIFFVSNLPATKDKRLKCVLSSGFVDATFPVTVKTAEYYADAVDEDYTVTELVTLVKNSQGVLIFPDEQPTGIVWVNYRAGFQEDPDNEGVYLGLPDWLTMAAIHYANAIYHRLVEQRDHEAEGKKAKASNYQILDAMPADLSPMVSEYIRFYPTGVSPDIVLTEEVA